MSQTVTVTDADFEKVVLKSQGAVLVDFWATWCSPCRIMGPVVEDLAEEYSGRLTVAKLDVDQNPSATQEFGIQSIPTLLLIDRGNPVERLVGVQPRRHLQHLLDVVLAAQTQRGAA
jgi:thioredoxin 1